MSQDNNILTPEKHAALLALQWYIDHDLADIIENEPVDRTAPPDLSQIHDTIEQVASPKTKAAQAKDVSVPVMGAAEAIREAQKITASCTSLENLKEAIENFKALSLKKTATNMVFADGNLKADIMVIGDAPGADEDAQGKAFVGEAGQLLNKILASIGLDRSSDDVEKSVYLTNLLNWRPPGNRTPTAQEVEISLPFIKKHIELVQPKYIIILGAVAGKALLDKKDSISKLRGQFHPYEDKNDQNTDVKNNILSFVTYHPTYLLRTPAQKRAVWADMLMLQAELQNKS